MRGSITLGSHTINNSTAEHYFFVHIPELLPRSVGQLSTLSFHYSFFFIIIIIAVNHVKYKSSVFLPTILMLMFHIEISGLQTRANGLESQFIPELENNNLKPLYFPSSLYKGSLKVS